MHRALQGERSAIAASLASGIFAIAYLAEPEASKAAWTALLTASGALSRISCLRGLTN